MGNSVVCGKQKPKPPKKYLDSDEGNKSVDLNATKQGSQEQDVSGDSGNEKEAKKEGMEDNYFSEGELQAYKVSGKFKPVDLSQSRASCKGNFDWVEGEQIGSGAFGQVFLGLNLRDRTYMAVKKVFIQEGRGKQSKIESLMKEMEMYKSLSHKNIVRYLGSEQRKDSINIFLEFIDGRRQFDPGGSILEIINKYGGALTESIAKQYTKQILEGLEYLHYNGVIHRDIKSANVLVGRDAVCKLSDFGTAKSVSGLKGENSLCGTPNFIAPEVIQQKEYGRFADIWSIGCTVFEMVTGSPPWSHLHEVPFLSFSSNSTRPLSGPTPYPSFPSTFQKPVSIL
jgi:serine/threonine protein kinase